MNHLMIWVPTTSRTRAGRLYVSMYVSMSCNHPMKAFWTGSLTEKGKKELIVLPSTAGNYLNAAYAERKGFHIAPSAPLVEINGQVYLKDPVPLPCGHCIGCRMMSAREWKVRLCLEAMDYKDQCYFVTLTYDDEHLPIDENGQPFLVKSHVSEFMHSMRGRFNEHRKLRFFACGEYGSVTHRPHYHLILFGDIGELNPINFDTFESPRIYAAWPYGFHQVKRAESGTMSYTAGYMEKKQKDPLYGTYPVKPFRKMSTHPGIGFNQLKQIGFPDVCVYGDFGNIHYTSAPKGMLKKLENEPWYDDFKAVMLEKARLTQATQFHVLGSMDEEIAGERADKRDLARIEKVRKETL